MRLSMQRHVPFPASDALRKGKAGWMQFYMSSLPYLISLFVKRPLIGQGRSFTCAAVKLASFSNLPRLPG